MSLEITTNWHRRPVIYGFELTSRERKEFDYLSDAELEERQFARYRGDLYDLNDVMLAPDKIRRLGWDGFNPESFWGGPVFRYFDEDGYLLDGGDSVIMGYAHITG